MKSLITGCAGFIGHKTCEEFLNKGYEVFGIDDLNDYYDVQLKLLRLKTLTSKKNFTFKKVDVTNKNSVEKIVRNFLPDIIVNLAARAGVRASILNPYIYFQVNTMATLNLLELAKKYKSKKFIFSSTSSLYAGQKMPFTEILPVNEPISPYAASKKSAEVTCYTYNYLYGIDITILRYFTVYGPWGRPDMSIFRFIKQIDEGKKIIVYGDGSQSRDFTYIDDIGKGTFLAKKSLGFEIINLGSDDPHDLKEVIRTIENLLGKKAEIIYKAFHPSDMKSTWAGIEKAKKLLGWTPAVSFNEGLKRTVEWYIENKKQISRIQI
ncbi:MAG: GDP-mannose 4,6-dehydratase [Actinobacteria bacterium]|nr:GDP-mannose 4,6-dehydratase [Actinomycetota bacterium]MCL5674931.1 GDP-mannose 4,6-dehydratase [Candidatus Omnitrophota bacterium]